MVEVPFLIIEGNPMSNNTLSVTVKEKSQQTQDIIKLTLEPNEGSSLPEYSPGSHIDVHLPNGMIRQYSLFNLFDETEGYEIAILKDAEGRGGSVSIHDDVNVGDSLMISEPRNQFELTKANDYILFAGGIGVTPILSMANKLAALADNFEMHYFAKSETTAAFVNHLKTSSYQDNVDFHFDDKKELSSKGAEDILKNPKQGARVFVCGPEGFMQYIIDTAKAQGWADENIHYEYFKAPVVETSEAESGEKSFYVELNKSAETILVDAGKTVVEALAEKGIEIPVSCEQGFCGTCLLDVIEGTPDHRDFFLTDDEKKENNQFTPCCSRSLSDKLVLDL